MIGDSTMAWYRSPKFPIEGWGMPFADFFNSTVTVKNKAEGGESTRTFIEEKLWKPVADSLRLVIIFLFSLDITMKCLQKKAIQQRKILKQTLSGLLPKQEIKEQIRY